MSLCSGIRAEIDMTNFVKLPTFGDDGDLYVVVETPRGTACRRLSRSRSVRELVASISVACWGTELSLPPIAK